MENDNHPVVPKKGLGYRILNPLFKLVTGKNFDDFMAEKEAAEKNAADAESRAAKAKAEAETAKAEAAKAKVEAAKAKAEAETAKAEAARAKAEAEMAQAETEAAKAEAVAAREEAKEAKAEAEMAKQQAAKAQAEETVETEAKETKVAEEETNTPEAAKTETGEEVSNEDVVYEKYFKDILDKLISNLKEDKNQDGKDSLMAYHLNMAKAEILGKTAARVFNIAPYETSNYWYELGQEFDSLLQNVAQLDVSSHTEDPKKDMRDAFASELCSCISGEFLNKGFGSVINDLYRDNTNLGNAERDRFEKIINEGSKYESLRKTLTEKVSIEMESKSVYQTLKDGVEINDSDIVDMLDLAFKENLSNQGVSYQLLQFSSDILRQINDANGIFNIKSALRESFSKDIDAYEIMESHTLAMDNIGALKDINYDSEER